MHTQWELNLDCSHIILKSLPQYQNSEVVVRVILLYSNTSSLARLGLQVWLHQRLPIFFPKKFPKGTSQYGLKNHFEIDFNSNWTWTDCHIWLVCLVSTSSSVCIAQTELISNLKNQSLRCCWYRPEILSVLILISNESWQTIWHLLGIGNVFFYAWGFPIMKAFFPPECRKNEPVEILEKPHTKNDQVFTISCQLESTNEELVHNYHVISYKVGIFIVFNVLHLESTMIICNWFTYIRHLIVKLCAHFRLHTLVLPLKAKPKPRSRQNWKIGAYEHSNMWHHYVTNLLWWSFQSPFMQLFCYCHSKTKEAKTDRIFHEIWMSQRRI